MLNITFNYDFDTEGFFSGPEGITRRTTLEQAASFYENFITDSLLAIPTDSGLNSWTAIFSNPATGNQQSIQNLTIPEDTIIVYAGGRDLPLSLGEGGPGGFSASGTADFLELIKGRGQVGALTEPATDYSLWGGSITFDTNILIDSTSFNWHNSIDTVGLDSDEIDFLSVATHELGHVLGFVTGLDNSWSNQISGTGFTGINSLAIYQAETDPNATSVPLKEDRGHWANGITSFTLTGAEQEPSMNTGGEQLGERQLLTNLDYASFQDIGWEIDFSSLPDPTNENPNPANENLNTPIYRFQSKTTAGTYLFVGEQEKQNINQNFAHSFTEEGIAFHAAVEPNDELIPLFRFQSTQQPGTYLFAGEAERNSINADPNLSNSFIEEGIAFYIYGAGAGEATIFSRFQNSLVPGTYLYATGAEANNIRNNLTHFIEEGMAFEAGI